MACLLVQLLEKEKKARDTLLAWQSTKDSLRLKDASGEERFGLVWKLVLTFLSGSDVNLASLRAAMAVVRRRARLRAAGLRAFRDLLSSVALSSVKREILASLLPSLHPSERDAYQGLAADIMHGLRGCGDSLVRETQTSFKLLYEELARILARPTVSGGYLIQSTLHAFSLNYVEEEFELVVSLGIFKALQNMLATDEELEAAAAAVKEKAVAVMGSEEFKGEKRVAKRRTWQTSAFALLDLLCEHVMKSKNSTFFSHALHLSLCSMFLTRAYLL